MPDPLALTSFIAMVAPRLSEGGFRRSGRDFLYSDPEFDSEAVVNFQSAPGFARVGFFVNIAAGPRSYLDFAGRANPEQKRTARGGFGLWRDRWQPPSPGGEDWQSRFLQFEIWSYDSEESRAELAEYFAAGCPEMLALLRSLTDPAAILRLIEAGDPPRRMQLRNGDQFVALHHELDPAEDVERLAHRVGADPGSDFVHWLAAHRGPSPPG